MNNVSASASPSSEQQIANLLAAYAYRNDDVDIPGLGDLFVAAVFTLDGTVAHGKAEVEALARQMIPVRPDGLSGTSHEIINIVIHVDEAAQTATAQSCWTLYQSVSGSPRDAVLAGRYADTFQCRDGRWHFTARHAVIRWNAAG